MYAVVTQKHYARVTSYLRAAALAGKFMAFALAQFLISTGYGSYLLLNQVFYAVSDVFFINLREKKEIKGQICGCVAKQENLLKKSTAIENLDLVLCALPRFIYCANTSIHSIKNNSQ